MKPKLCKLGDLPDHLQFNKDIWTGYRVPMSAADCLRSWTYLHNESFNCYSHIFALLYFLWSVRDYASVWPSQPSPTSTTVKLLILGDCLCSLLPFILSTIYHTFMPHQSGEKTYKQLLKADVFGVWWCCTLGPISNVYCGMFCTPALMLVYFSVYMSLSAYMLYYLMVLDCKRKRVIALTVQFFIRILIHPVRLSTVVYTTSASVKYYFITDIVSAVGAVINALHVPERWFPGKLGYFLNGHTLMHIAAFVSVLSARYGFLSDMTWMNEVGSCPGEASSLHTLEAVLFGKL